MQNTTLQLRCGIIIISTVVRMAAKPSLRDETLATPPFSFRLFPISMAIRVPMMLQGPLMKKPTQKMVTQYGHTSSPSAKDIRNIVIEPASREGLRNRAFLLKKSARKPTNSPPVTAPMSSMAEMQPFWSDMGPECSSRRVGSQKSRPQKQPLRQAQEKTYIGTFGINSTEKIPYFEGRASGASSFSSFEIICSFSIVWRDYDWERRSWPAGSSSNSFLSVSDYSRVFWGSGSGFSLRKSRMERAVSRPIPPVSTKFQAKLALWSDSRLSSAEAIMSPMLALQDQTPIRKPFFLPENQRLNMPMMPGQPVAWKKPLTHIKTVITPTLKKPVAAQSTIHSMQLTLDTVSPTSTQFLSLNRCMKLPMTIIPVEQKTRQRASTIPRYSLLTPNQAVMLGLEQDQPARSAWREAYTMKVSRKTKTLQSLKPIQNLAEYL